MTTPHILELKTEIDKLLRSHKLIVKHTGGINEYISPNLILLEDTIRVLKCALILAELRIIIKSYKCGTYLSSDSTSITNKFE